MNSSAIRIAIGIALTLLLHGPCGAAQPASNPSGGLLCATYVGPAFILPDVSSDTVAVHAGQLRGVSFFALNTGRSQGHILVSQRILAASMPAGAGTLTLALADRVGVLISRYDVSTRRASSSHLLSGLNAELAIFAPDGQYLLGVTDTGRVFRANLASSKVDLLETSPANANSLAVSRAGATMYVVGDGLTVIDYERMTLIPMSVSATHLLEVVESYDGRALVLRHFDYVEKLSMAGPEKGKVLVSNVVDSAPDVASLDSTHRLTFAPDGASLFFVRAAKSGSELVTLSSEDLRVETRSPIGPYPSAISAVPDRHWVLVTTGFAGNEQLEALDTIKHAVVFRAILPGGSTSPTKSLGAC